MPLLSYDIMIVSNKTGIFNDNPCLLQREAGRYPVKDQRVTVYVNMTVML